MQSTDKAYRLIPDQKIRIAEYRFYWLVGKSLLLLMLFISLPMVFGMIQAHGLALSWLLVVPFSLVVGLLWKGFPAFCRCPDCRKRLVSRSKVGKVFGSHKLFDEIGPTKHYLVCDRCMLYLFLGETSDSD
jgi:hypothetical protein